MTHLAVTDLEISHTVSSSLNDRFKMAITVEKLKLKIRIFMGAEYSAPRFPSGISQLITSTRAATTAALLLDMTNYQAVHALIQLRPQMFVRSAGSH